MAESIPNFTNAKIIGAGANGLIVQPDGYYVYKLFYDLSITHEEIMKEAKIQRKIHELFGQNIFNVYVPDVRSVMFKTIIFQENKYICGIEMDYCTPPENFNEAVHILLGYSDDDIDSSWGKNQNLSVSSNTKGFFASPNTINKILIEEKKRREIDDITWLEDVSIKTVDEIAFLMGKSIRLMLDNNILPIDIEWIWAKETLSIIDFGLCREGSVDKHMFLEMGHDIYLPHKGGKYHDSFMKGFANTEYDTKAAKARFTIQNSTFALSENQIERANNWAKHNNFDNSFTFSFIPTCIGIIAKIEHESGAILDFSDDL